MKSNWWLNGNCKTPVGYLQEKQQEKQLQQQKQTEKDKSSLEYNIKCNIPPDVLHTRKSILVLVWQYITNVDSQQCFYKLYWTSNIMSLGVA